MRKLPWSHRTDIVISVQGVVDGSLHMGEQAHRVAAATATSTSRHCNEHTIAPILVERADRNVENGALKATARAFWL